MPKQARHLGCQLYSRRDKRKNRRYASFRHGTSRSILIFILVEQPKKKEMQIWLYKWLTLQILSDFKNDKIQLSNIFYLFISYWNDSPNFVSTINSASTSNGLDKRILLMKTFFMNVTFFSSVKSFSSC